jgi:predicted metal-dependent hydrolase
MIKPPGKYSIQYGTTEIEYELSYKDRETLAINVHPDKKVTVEAPTDSEFEEVEKRVLKRAAWIVKQQREFDRYYFDLPPRQYVSGETHRYLGRQYRLKVIQTEEQETIKMDRGRIMVFTKQPHDRDRVKKILQDWYRAHAQTIFKERLEMWLPRFERFDLGKFELTIRIMKSQWGSCTQKGKITLNLKLIHVPKHLIDYVIVHEICHLVEHNHSSAFYALMSRIMPDWEEKREKLNSFEF